jgi:hypothetical protein
MMMMMMIIIIIVTIVTTKYEIQELSTTFRNNAHIFNGNADDLMDIQRKYGLILVAKTRRGQELDIRTYGLTVAIKIITKFYTTQRSL